MNKCVLLVNVFDVKMFYNILHDQVNAKEIATRSKTAMNARPTAPVGGTVLNAKMTAPAADQWWSTQVWSKFCITTTQIPIEYFMRRKLNGCKQAWRSTGNMEWQEMNTRLVLRWPQTTFKDDMIQKALEFEIWKANKAEAKNTQTYSLYLTEGDSFSKTCLNSLKDP